MGRNLIGHEGKVLEQTSVTPEACHLLMSMVGMVRGAKLLKDDANLYD